MPVHQIRMVGMQGVEATLFAALVGCQYITYEEPGCTIMVVLIFLFDSFYFLI